MNRDVWKSRQGICLAIIFAVSVFYLLTIRAGQPWTDDFALYIGEAKNLAHHTPLSQTGYIYNRFNAGLGPRLYPPVFPVLLVPGYLIGGLNSLIPMQVEIVVFSVSLLVVLWRRLGAALTLPYRAAMLALLGFNPLLWTYKDLIISDVPFTFFLYLALAEADRFVTGSGDATKNSWRILGLAGLVYICYGTRTTGIILVPALLLLAAMYWRQGGRSVAGAAMLGLIPCLVQWRFLNVEGTYGDQLRLGVPRLVEGIFHNVVAYGWSLSTFWENPYSKVLRDVILIFLTLLAGLAYLRRIRTVPRIYEIFFPLYLSVVLFWPNPGGDRYLIPIFPLYVYYCLEGAETVRTWLKIRKVKLILVPLLASIFLSYGAEFIHADFGPFKEGVTSQEARALFSFIKSNTNTDDVFIFRRPRALALFAERKAAVYPSARYEANSCRYFQTIGATYIIEAPALDDSGFEEFLKRENLSKQSVFSNAHFDIFRVHAEDLERCADDSISAGSVLSRSP